MTSLPRFRPAALLGLGALLSAGGLAAGCGDDSEGSGGATSSSVAGPSTTPTATSGGSPTSTSASTGQGGAGGSVPDDTTPIDAPDDTWTYVPFPNAVCMNGTPTGININKTSTSDDVVIFFEGGNACFNALSCAATAHKDGYGPAEAADDVPTLESAELFHRDSTSLLKDYNFVEVPYCTGDVHAGDNDTNVGGADRTFHGYGNVGRYLKRILPTFPNAHKVIVVGVSAGGFGAAFNYDRISQAFGSGVDVKLIDDSGPPMSKEFVPACLQKHFVDTWGLNNTLPTTCADCQPADGAFMEPLIHYVATTYSDKYLSLISSTEDQTISLFWGFGHDDCSNVESPGAFPGATYTAGLEDLRDNSVAGAEHFKVFLIDGTNEQDKTHHVWLSPDPASVVSNDVNLVDWLTQMLAEDPAWANVP